jgi:hypothetical protein
MSEGVYHSDPQEQQRAQDKIDHVVRHGEWTLERFLIDYRKVCEWMGTEDEYARNMQAAQLDAGVIRTMQILFEGLRAAYMQALQLSSEIQRPRDHALQEINNLNKVTPRTSVRG